MTIALVAEVRRLLARLEREKTARRSAETIAEQATAELYRKHQEVLLMQRIAVAANSAARLEDAFQSAVDLVCAHTGWPIGHIYLVDGDQVAPTAIWHFADPARHEPFR